MDSKFTVSGLDKSLKSFSNENKLIKDFASDGQQMRVLKGIIVDMIQRKVRNYVSQSLRKNQRTHAKKEETRAPLLSIT